MRIAIFLCGFLLFGSCDIFTSKEVKTQELVDREMQNINFNDVDQFPLFENCDETHTKEENRQCFEKTLLHHFSTTLEGFEFVLKEAMVDTLYVDFLVDKKGKISVLDIEHNAIVEEQIPEFDAIITRGLQTLPKVSPALKRGIPVTTKFRIPIIVNTK